MDHYYQEKVQSHCPPLGGRLEVVVYLSILHARLKVE